MAHGQISTGACFHHAIIYVDSANAGRRRLAASGEDSYRCVGGPGFPATEPAGARQ